MRLYYYKISFFLNGDYVRDFFVYSDSSISHVKERFSSVQKSDNYCLVFRCTKKDAGFKRLYSLDFAVACVESLQKVLR